MAWERFCHTMGNVPVSLMDGPNPLPVSVVSDHICDFVSFEFFRGIKPSSLKRTYLTSIAKDFAVRRVRNNFAVAKSSTDVKIILDGISRIYYKGNPLHGTRRLAFTAELLPFVRPAMLARSDSSTTDQDEKACEHLALKLGMWYCLRKSEFLPNQKHPGLPRFSKGLPLDCVIFSDAEGRVIPFHTIAVGRAAKMTIKIIFSKTDQEGAGRVRTTTACPEPQKSCLVREMEAWLVRLRDHFHADPVADHLFYVDERVFITADRVTETIKTTVIYCGLPAERYSAHSLRYGGATMLASSGMPMYLIEYHGGWAANSASLRGYLQIGSAETDELLTAVFRAAESKLSLDAVRSRHVL